MKTKLISLFCACFILLTAVDTLIPRSEGKVFDNVIRLHILADDNSDTAQSIKLKVRDAVLAQTQVLLQDVTTRDEARAARFLRLVDSAAVYHNASTRFTDGGEFGFGAEIGISTQKMHARGPMGLMALTSQKYLIEGDGTVR